MENNSTKSLGKFGLPSQNHKCPKCGHEFNDRGGLLELRKKYKFKLIFTNFGNGENFELEDEVRSVELPNQDHKPINVHLNYGFGLDKDYIEIMVGKQIQKQMDEWTTKIKAEQTFWFDLQIIVTDNHNIICRNITIKQCAFDNVNFGDMDFHHISRSMDFSIKYDLMVENVD